MVKLPNLGFPILNRVPNIKIVKSEFKSENNKNKHRNNVFIKENKKKDIVIDMMTVTLTFK